MNEQVEGVRSLNQVVQIDESRIQAHLEEVVRNTVEETLNALVDAEANRLCGAQRYERNAERKNKRAGGLSAVVADQGRRGQSEGSEASQPTF
jgi:transposase-like protein